jgi:hypothetical protein
MVQIFNKVRVKKANSPSGLTLVESTVIVGALAVFASIYTFVIAGAITSRLLTIS